MKKQSGLTLIELIIVVVILGILAAFTVPNFGGLVRANQLKTSYNTLVGILATSRSEAANRSTTIMACVSTDGSSCVANSSTKIWSDGYLVFVDTNRNGARDTGGADDEEILRYEPAIGSNITITASSPYERAISIVPRGRLRSQATFTFCSGDDVDTAKALNLWITGLSRLATDSDDDTDSIVEGVDGTNVNCPS